jgi:hypothetical protein
MYLGLAVRVLLRGSNSGCGLLSASPPWVLSYIYEKLDQKKMNRIFFTFFFEPIISPFLF